jgi:hypothetical protein
MMMITTNLYSMWKMSLLWALQMRGLRWMLNTEME